MALFGAPTPGDFPKKIFGTRASWEIRRSGFVDQLYKK
jgi:hypothetical protein